MRLIRLAAAAAVTMFVTASPSLAEKTKPEELLKMRQGVFQAVKANFVPLLAIAKGSAKPDDQTAQYGENLAALAKIVPMGFGPGTEDLPKSDTKPAAFTSPDFAKAAKMFQAESVKLAEAAKSGDVEAIKAQVGAVGKACKACHDDFRKE